MKYRILVVVSFVLAMLHLGCSDNPSSTNNDPPNNQKESCFYIKLNTSTKFTYSRSDLDSTNNIDVATARSYSIDYLFGRTVIGAYMDWMYQIGTDGKTQRKDSVYIRVINRIKKIEYQDTTRFTMDIMIYGFQMEIINRFIKHFKKQFPITEPSVQGPGWDYVARYHDLYGSPLSDGFEWFHTPEMGQEFTFIDIPLLGSVKINVKYKGALDSKSEVIMVWGKLIKTWKASTIATFTGLGNELGKMRISMWYSDNPSGLIKLVRESALFSFMNTTFWIPGEVIELVSYEQ